MGISPFLLLLFLFCNSREYKAKNDGKNNRQAEGVGRESTKETVGDYGEEEMRMQLSRNICYLVIMISLINF